VRGERSEEGGERRDRSERREERQYDDDVFYLFLQRLKSIVEEERGRERTEERRVEKDRREKNGEMVHGGQPGTVGFAL
jgi:hypothetical protein